jgi:chromosome segregation ATPase
MSLFRRSRSGPADLIRVKSEIGRLQEALERHDERAKQLEDALTSQPDAAALTGRIDAIDETLAGNGSGDVAARLDRLVARLDDLESRVTSVSTELANQLSELGDDIESLQNRPPGEIDEESIDELRDTQTRLANEQVRYQIAFRADLARLAEQLRRPNPDVRRRGGA